MDEPPEAVPIGSLVARLMARITRGERDVGEEEGALKEMRGKLQDALLDAQAALLSAQDNHAALVKREGDLEKEVARLKDWTAERARYRLECVATGAYAYALKPEMENGEPPHWLCAACYDAGKKSILQIRAKVPNQSATWACNGCQGTILTGSRAAPFVQAG